MFVFRVISQLSLWVVFLSLDCATGQVAKDKVCLQAQEGIQQITVIGLMKDRFVCILLHGSKSYYAYDLAINSVDSENGKVYLYSGQPLNKTWSNLQTWLVKYDYKAVQMITIRGYSKDYVFLYNITLHNKESKENRKVEGKGKDKKKRKFLNAIFKWDSNKMKHNSKIKVNFSIWISSMEEMAFYGIKSNHGLTITKYKFDDTRDLPEASRVKKMSDEYHICKSGMNKSINQISIQKKSKCSFPITIRDWYVTAGFSDAHRIYLFIGSGTQNSVIILEKLAMAANLGVSHKVHQVPQNQFFICAAPPISSSDNNIHHTVGTSGASIMIGIVFAVILLLSCAALAICWLCRLKPQGRPLNALPNTVSQNQDPVNAKESSLEEDNLKASSSVSQAKLSTGCVPLPTKCVRMPKQKASDSKGKSKRGSRTKSSTPKTRAKRSASKSSTKAASSKARAKTNSKRKESRKKVSRSSSRNRRRSKSRSKSQTSTKSNASRSKRNK